jgi:DNA-binding transcriptional regulator YhcF (GntR family)
MPPQDPPYRRIAADIRARIASGELRAGERMPSIRQVARHWGVAIATATKAMATLRDDGLVEPTVGSGTVVSARASRQLAGQIAPLRQATRTTRVRSREQVIRTAIAFADTEGLDALSMRRLAAEVGISPMSLYRHVANKDDLMVQMADAVFGERDLPDPGPDGWRAKLELVSRLHWDLFRRHLWLPKVISFTRPLLMPNAMAHTEWTLRALDDLELPVAIRTREAIALPALIVTIALSLVAEVEAGQESGVTFQQWWQAREKRTAALLSSGRFPLLATVPQEIVADLDGLFEYTLARHLDGLAALIESDHTS